MKRNASILVAMLVLVAVLLTGWLVLDMRRAQAATPIGGAISAQSGSGVTRNRFVYLSADGVIDLATSASVEAVGVCEANAASGAVTRYAPVGTITNVQIGEAVAAGNLLTAGTSGYAYVVDTNDPLNQRVCAMALTTDADANDNPTVKALVLASSCEGPRAFTADTIPGTPVCFVADANADGNTSIIVPYAVRVIDIWTVQVGASSDANATVTVQNGANAMSAALSLAGADDGIARAATLVDAYQDVAAAGEICVATALVDVTGVRVYILALPK
ncbi:MAG TPA: hypothetical protein VMW52_07415 [Phycisphaerae bacterium]|nr:hypothetical protein [Phycisphaerae bacterium]